MSRLPRDVVMEIAPDGVRVEGMTEEGIDFVDSYTALDVHVVDAGVIMLPVAGSEAFQIRAREAHLHVAIERVA